MSMSYRLQQKLRHQQQHELTPLQTAIQQWAVRELPSVPPLRAQTLRQLTELPGADRLFQFLTTRVHSCQHTEAIRANLLLHSNSTQSLSSNNRNFSANLSACLTTASDHYESSEDIEDLQSQLAAAEERLSRLRHKLKQKKQGQKQKQKRSSLNIQDGYASLFPATSGSTRAAARAALVESLLPARIAARDAISALRILQIEQVQSDENDRELCEIIENLAQTTLFESDKTNQRLLNIEKESFEARTLQLQTDIEELIKNHGVSSVAKQLTSVAQDMTRQCEEERDRCVQPNISVSEYNEEVNIPNDLTEDQQEDEELEDEDEAALARDAILRAGAGFRTARSAVERAKEKHTTGVVIDGEGYKDSDALAFLSRIEIGKSDDLNGTNDNMRSGQSEKDFEKEYLLKLGQLRAQREAAAEMSRRRVHDLQKVTRKLAHACSVMLESIFSEGVQARNMDGQVTREVTHATDLAGRKAYLIERCLQDALTYRGNEDVDNVRRVNLTELVDFELDRNVHTIDERTESLFRWKHECDVGLHEIKQRVGASLTTRDAVIDRFYQIINDKLRKCLADAEHSRERDVVLAQREMNNLATLPGIHYGRKILRGEFE